MANAAITVDLNARIAQFETELKRATGTLDKFGQRGNAIATGLKSAFAGMAAGLSVGALAAFAKSGIDAADALNDMSQRLGVSVKDLASFQLAAEQSGTSLDGVGVGIARLTRSIGDAEGGNKKLAQALIDLGITARDPKEAFFQLADAVKTIEDPAKRATLLNQVLGKSYQELVPLLAQGGDELRRSAEASETFADAMARLAPDADRFNDQLAALKINAAGAAASILSELVPSFNEWIAVGKEVVKTGTLLDKIRFFGLGNASDDMVRRVRLNVAAASGWANKLRDSAASLNGKKQVDTSAVTRSIKPKGGGTKTDPLASLLSSTDIGKTQEYNKLLALLNARFDNGKKNAELYAQAVAKLNDQFGKTQIDVFDSGSFKTADKDVAEFIKSQQDAINGMNLEMEWDTTKLDAFLENTDFSRLKKDQEDMIFLTKAFTDGVIGADGELRKLSETEYLDAVKNRLGLVGEAAEETGDAFKEFGMIMVSAFEEAIASGGDLSDVMKGLEQDLIKMGTRKLVTDPLSKFVDGLSMNSIPSFGGSDQNILGSIASLFGFAKGGIMSASGPLHLKSYASGGIASSPQLALYGEGSMNEAYVPLPDGRSIPVNMRGNGGSTVIMNISTPDANSFRASQGQITAQMTRALARGRRYT